MDTQNQDYVEASYNQKVRWPHHFRNLFLVATGSALLFSFVCINELNKGVQDFQNKCAYIQQRVSTM